MPDDLVAQIEPIHAAVRRAGLAGCRDRRHRGRRRDRHARTAGARPGLQTVISTGDKDLAQLVDERTTLVNTMSNETLDVAGRVGQIRRAARAHRRLPDADRRQRRQRAGRRKGGAEDGGQMAADVRFARRDRRKRRSDQRRGGRKPAQGAAWLPTAKALVTIKTDCDLSTHVPSLSALEVRDEDAARLREIYQRYEFKAWMREVDRAVWRRPRPAQRPQVLCPSVRLGPSTKRSRHEAARRMVAAHRRRRPHLHRHRNHVARSDGGAPGRHLAVGRAAEGLLHPARAPLSRRARAA